MSCNNAGDESAWNQKSLLCVYEIPKEVEYITAPPRMKLYIDYSSEIYAVYLEYIAKEDIHVYSIDEAFLDVTEYLKKIIYCLLYTSPSPRDRQNSRMPSSA